MLTYNLMKYYVIHVINTLLKLNHIDMEMTAQGTILLNIILNQNYFQVENTY